jgi:hypothetical protein
LSKPYPQFMAEVIFPEYIKRKQKVNQVDSPMEELVNKLTPKQIKFLAARWAEPFKGLRRIYRTLCSRNHKEIIGDYELRKYLLPRVVADVSRIIHSKQVDLEEERKVS